MASSSTRAAPSSGSGAPDPSAHALLSLSHVLVTTDGSQRSPRSLLRSSRAPSDGTSDKSGINPEAADQPFTSAETELLVHTAATNAPPAAAPTVAIDTAANGSKPKRVRKRTYYMRKEETEALLDELRELKARMAFYHAREGLADQWKHIRRQQQDNRVLRDVLRSQWLLLANTHGMTGRFMQEHSSTSSVESGIRLGLDPAQRHAALLALKSKKLADAVSFLQQRGRSLNHARASVDTQRFETEQGDYCSMRFDVTPFEGLRSARQVFDAYLNFAFNMEINVSETLGDITIREDDEIIGSQSDGVSHHRMVSTISNSVQLDLNSVVFSEFFPSGRDAMLRDSTGTDELGVAVFDVVEDDALYPYRPTERVRQDITCLAMVTSFQRRKVPSGPPSASSTRRILVEVADEELVVVLHRWSLLKVHRSDLSVPAEIQARIKSGIEHVGDAILATVRQAVYSTSSSTQPPAR